MKTVSLIITRKPSLVHNTDTHSSAPTSSLFSPLPSSIAAIMVSKSTFSSTSTGERLVDDLASLTYKINKLKKHIQAERVGFVKEKVTRNKRRLESDVVQLLSLAFSRSTTDDDSSARNINGSSLRTMLSSRIKNPLCLVAGKGQGLCDKDNNTSSTQDVAIHVTSKLPAVVDKIPPYTTWTFLTRNQRMAEDQSVIGKRCYYDQIGGEAIIFNDSTAEAIAESAEEPHEFSEAEKKIVRMVCQEYEPSEEVLVILKKFIGGTTSEITEVYNMLKEKDEETLNQNLSAAKEVEHTMMSVFLEKNLTTALDSIDALFCRLCLVFDCNLHGNSQPIITPSEPQEYTPESLDNEKPCSDQCYQLLQATMLYPERADSSNIDAITSNRCLHEDSSTSVDPDISKKEAFWKPLEKDLYLKGLQIYGRNSCLITRNLLPGLKTCIQVYNYMCDGGTVVSNSPNNMRTGVDHKGKEMASRSQLLHRKGRAKKLKYSLKSSGHPPKWRRIAYGKNRSNKQYTPCECKSFCGKECPCIKTSTCCEKYCGCTKSCKNRFRGCHCAKSQCRSQQCPCFAAARECDPDICRNCWVSCGGGSLGEPPRKGEGQCGNVRILLRQQHRILLGKSNVAGLGVFLKNSVSKDEYLGEYTGELISHQEADVRGSLYDRINSSFLFNLNDEYVIDAMRKGNKLKFANHSSKPNCYAKIIKVGGDHRVGIFAKESIEGGTELYYDYCYEPQHSPTWALKPDDSIPIPHARPKKHQSHQ